MPRLRTAGERVRPWSELRAIKSGIHMALWRHRQGPAGSEQGVQRAAHRLVRGEAPYNSLGVLAAVLFVTLSISSLAAAQAQPSGAQSAPAVQPAPTAQTPPAAPPAPASSTISPPPAPPSPTGWLAFEQLQYEASSLGNVIIADTDLGYGFTDHLSGDVGVPVIFSRSPFSPVIDHDYYWSVLLGEPYVDVKYTDVYHDINYTSILTGTIPARNEDRVFTTGRFGVDWFNHMDEQVGPITPFLNIEASNGAVNRFVMPRPFEEARPYQTLGFLADAEAGFESKLDNRFVKGVKIGASAYLLAPAGPQKVFSRFVFPYSSLAGDGHHSRYFDSAFETTGLSAIARDNGFSAWVEINRWRNLDIQLGYTRSVHYDLDIYTLMFNFDARDVVRQLLRRR